jgi:hypothetical protein
VDLPEVQQALVLTATMVVIFPPGLLVAAVVVAVQVLLEEPIRELGVVKILAAMERQVR